MTQYTTRLLAIILFAAFFSSASAVPMPAPMPNKSLQVIRSEPTAAPLSLQSLTELRAVLDFYNPSDALPTKREILDSAYEATPVKKRQGGYPTFPAQYPSW
jgi:hypothetical protein